jgi:hypothetical protein
MIEIGVALRWGIRLLIIRVEKSQSPPTDISGHIGLHIKMMDQYLSMKIINQIYFHD